jgi:hypothetical protein
MRFRKCVSARRLRDAVYLCKCLAFSEIRHWRSKSTSFVWWRNIRLIVKSFVFFSLVCAHYSAHWDWETQAIRSRREERDWQSSCSFCYADDSHSELFCATNESRVRRRCFAELTLCKSSLAVELSFGQKFKSDPRVDVRPDWTDQSSQPDSRIDVRRVLPSLFETSYI